MLLCTKITPQCKGIYTISYSFVSAKKSLNIIGSRFRLLTFTKFVEFLKISIVKDGCSVFSYFPAWRYAYAGLEFKRISGYICLYMCASKKVCNFKPLLNL